MAASDNGLIDVLSGNKSLQFEVVFDLKSTLILGAVLFVVILGAIYIGRTVTK